MSTTAAGTFELVWDEQPPYLTDEGTTLSKVVVTKTFTGDIQGTSVTELIKAMTSEPTSAGYVAIERLTGTVHGRKGTFILQHSAISTRGEGDLNIVIVPDSGTGELSTISGRLNVVPAEGTHSYTLEYELNDSV
ncbi:MULTISPECIES: DUF3224 domain-containing protein [Streptomyces]|uniref:DUF3224 domain-containing protein n=2 Tax=Streptomyces TaxID=1883 RepID=A0A7K3RSN7_9ACTN|nr:MULTISPECIES: DUF3224 domain-containing protein [Streptomyces]NEC18251.1 DUF3224 domain-containing protein [Streptomyces parvus]PJN27249.1 hypothetical protein CG717_26745 [Streptomyces sp. CB02613]SCE60121.1 Protein of unknown function [Streptomyces sp. Termitarium-T10T-6]